MVANLEANQVITKERNNWLPIGRLSAQNHTSAEMTRSNHPDLIQLARVSSAPSMHRYVLSQLTICSGNEKVTLDQTVKLASNRFLTGTGPTLTYNPGKRAGRLNFGHQLPFVRTKLSPPGYVWIHAANIHSVGAGKDLQARGDGERRPVGRPRCDRCVWDEERGAVGRTLRLEEVVALLAD